MKLIRGGLAVAVLATCFYISAIMFLATKPSNYISEEDAAILSRLQQELHQCVRSNGIGIYSKTKDYCTATFFFSNDTEAKWRDAKTGDMEPLTYDLDLCESLVTWEQVRNSSTILTKEYIDQLPNGWHEYAWRRINKGPRLHYCQDKKICMEKLSRVLPELPPFAPRQFKRCAVVGNSGDLLKAKFGEEIDTYDAVIRNNGAQIESYTEHVGSKRTLRLLNRGSAKALDKVAALDGTGKEVLIIKTTIHDVMNKMIKETPIVNPVYLMLGTSLVSSAKGTGVKALELALSVCEDVHVYGFTVDPGYSEWSRYFSEARGGHTPLLGRAYYQMMECLGLIKIHSPMRSARGTKTDQCPSKTIIEAARKASERVRRKAAQGDGDPLGSCVMWGKGASHQQQQRGEHDRFPRRVTQYPLEHSGVNGMLCVER